MPLLSILTPAIWSRREQAEALAQRIEQQIDEAKSLWRLGETPVEHVVVFDNRARSIGLKRQACLDVARGRYVAFVDDDDMIASNYVRSLLYEIECHESDVITFEQRVIVNQAEARCIFGLNQPDESFVAGQSFKRGPWHVCAWKRELVKDCVFPDTSYGEDLVWSQQARRRVRTSSHIPQILHEYRYNTATSAAPPPL